MRKVITSPFISLDGVTESPERWQFDHFDEGMMASMQTSLARTDAVLLGRVTYEEWAGYWPGNTEDEFAGYINEVPKYVATTQRLPQPTWNNTTILEGDLTRAVTELKARPGKDIAVTGSPGLVRSLIALDLLDELILTVHPVLAGTGKRLFGEDTDVRRLSLTNLERTPTGVAIMTYERRS